MYATDFEYDGQYLSDYKCIICNFDFSNGAVSASAGPGTVRTTAAQSAGSSVKALFRYLTVFFNMVIPLYTDIQSASRVLCRIASALFTKVSIESFSCNGFGVAICCGPLRRFPLPARV